MSYTASATRASSVHQKEEPKVTTRYVPRRRAWKVLGHGLEPGYVRDALLLRRPATLGKHLRSGVQADRLLEQGGEAHGEDAGAAPNVQKPSAAVEAKFLSKKSLKSR
jgi:hypothetical protein